MSLKTYITNFLLIFPPTETTESPSESIHKEKKSSTEKGEQKKQMVVSTTDSAQEGNAA
jgi:hypothetical protein